MNTAVLMYTGRTGETLNLLRRSLFGTCAPLASARRWVPLCESALRDWGKNLNKRDVLPLVAHAPLANACVGNRCANRALAGMGRASSFKVFNLWGLHPSHHRLSVSTAVQTCTAEQVKRAKKMRRFFGGVCILLASVRWRKL